MRQQESGRASEDRLPHAMMWVFSAIIAGSFPVAAAITQSIDALVLTFWRFVCATCFFALMLVFKGQANVPGIRDIGRYFVVGGSYSIFFILMFQSLKVTTAINTSVIYTTMPMITLILGAFVGETFSIRQVGVMALSMVAAVWVIFRGDWHRAASLDMSVGDLIFFCGTWFLAVYMIAMKRLQRDEPKLSFTFYSLAAATLLLFSACLASGTPLVFPGPAVWLGIAYLAGPSTAGTFWIIQYAAPRLGPGRVAAYTFLTPSLVLLMEWSLGISSPEWIVLPGIFLTLAALWILQKQAA